MIQIVFDNEAAGSSLPLGGKAASLALLQRHGFPVPRWFAITPQALPLPPKNSEEFSNALQQVLRLLAPNGELVAVRSSAIEEDGQEHSFAGMFESLLFVHPQNVEDAIRTVWLSATGPRVKAYCTERNLPLPEQTPAVIVQRMVNAQAAGVAFSADPLSSTRDVSVISAVHGLGSSLVSGECDADTAYVASGGTLLHYRRAHKAVRHVLNRNEGGLLVVQNDSSLAEKPVLHLAELNAINALVRRAQEFYQAPQDIEWAIEGGQLFLLQCRPITALPQPPEADTKAKQEVYSKSTLAESWYGALTPMTFSLARRLTTLMYRTLVAQTCIAKTPPEQIAPFFERLLKQFDGRVYLNQTQLDEIWFNAPSLEYKLAQLWRKQLPSAESVPVALCFWHVVWKQFSQSWENRSFIRRVNRVLRETKADQTLSRQDTAFRLEKLLAFIDTHWQAPTMTNYLATHVFKLYNWLSDIWGVRTNVALLLAGVEENVSRDLVHQLNAMAELARTDNALKAVLLSGDPKQLEHYPVFAKKFAGYMSRYGERCYNDLMLESLSQHEDPAALMQTVAALSEGAQRISAQDLKSDIPDTLPRNRKIILRFFLDLSRTQVSRRERLRFEVSRLTGRLRILLKTAGLLLAQEGLIAAAEDVYYLTLDELLDALHGKSVPKIVERKERYTREKQLSEPAETIITYGALRFEEKPLAIYQDGQMTGVGCSVGVVEGTVCMFAPDKPHADYSGKILLAPFGDPGLVTLFPVIKGLLLEHGSALSHAAIVARELGVPAVSGLFGLTGWLQDGDIIAMDGQSGTVQKK